MNFRTLKAAIVSAILACAFLPPYPRASQVVFVMTNTFGVPDTNSIRVLTLDKYSPVAADGSIITTGGLPQIWLPGTNGWDGTVTNWLPTGNYFFTNAVLRCGMAYRFPDSSSNSTAYRISAGNTFYNTPAIIANQTNGLATTNYVNLATNGLVTITVTNGLASLTYVQSVTNGFVTAGITNGLSTILYALSSISATNSANLQITTNLNAANLTITTNLILASTNGIVAAANIARITTNGPDGSKVITTNQISPFSFNGFGNEIDWQSEPSIIPDQPGTFSTFLGGRGTLGAGEDNVMVGDETGAALAVGQENTAVGQGSFYNSDGSENSAFGTDSLRLQEGGYNNTAFGGYSLSALVNGSNNIAMGYQAGIGLQGNETNDIDIGSVGTTGENNVIRIGSTQLTNILAGKLFGNAAGLTNGVALTNGLATIAYVTAATNGFVTASVTNGLATLVAVSATNTASLTAATNLVISATNGTVAAVAQSGLPAGVLTNNQTTLTTFGNTVKATIFSITGGGTILLTSSGSTFSLQNNGSGNSITCMASNGNFTANAYIGNAFITNTLVAGSLIGNGSGITNLSATNIVHAAITTNFISGQFYTNNYGITIGVSGSVALTTASIAGFSQMQLQAFGNSTNYSTVISAVAGLTGAMTNAMATTYVSPGNYFTWTNTSSGAGDTSQPTTGQIFY